MTVPIHAHPVLAQQQKRIKSEHPCAPPVLINPADEAPLPPPSQLPASKSKSAAAESATVVIINYKTERLLGRCLKSFLDHYPDVQILLVDNGSGDESTELVHEADARYETVTAVFNEMNIGHGPAMDDAVHLAGTRYVFTMDSDCQTLKGGFLEEMLKFFKADEKLYALGWLRYVDWFTGVPAPRPEGFMPYVHPSAAMYDREKYLKLYPFIHAGAPATRNMREALEMGYGLRSFPIHEYVAHLTAGTRRMFGGRWNPDSNETPGLWREDARFPI